MTHNDIYTKFMIEYDKANVTSSYPSLTEYEVATVLDKAYNALIAQKVTGNNFRRVGFEADLKSIADITPLIKKINAVDTLHADEYVQNMKYTELPEDFLYFVNAYLTASKTVKYNTSAGTMVKPQLAVRIDENTFRVGDLKINISNNKEWKESMQTSLYKVRVVSKCVTELSLYGVAPLFPENEVEEAIRQLSLVAGTYTESEIATFFNNETLSNRIETLTPNASMYIAVTTKAEPEGNKKLDEKDWIYVLITKQQRMTMPDLPTIGYVFDANATYEMNKLVNPNEDAEYYVARVTSSSNGRYSIVVHAHIDKLSDFSFSHFTTVQKNSKIILMQKHVDDTNVALKENVLYITPHRYEYKGVPYDSFVNRKLPVRLVNHEIATKFFSTAYNMPWIKIPVGFIENNIFNILYDPLNDDIFDSYQLVYVKKPNLFAKDLDSIDAEQDLSYFECPLNADDEVKALYEFECNSTVAEELISLAIAFALENVESQRLNSKLNMRGLEA